jgi:DNA-binding IclR family transcriptional regulator
MAARESSAGPQSATGQGIERVSTILKALADRARTGARLTDIAVATGLSKSTVHRLIGTLTAEGLVETDVKTGLIYLGYAMCVIGSAAANRYGLVNVGHETMEALEKLTEDTIYLSVRAGDDAICIDRVVGSFPIKVLTLNVGDRRPLGVGAGSLALLAALDDAEIGEVIERNAAKLAEYPNYGIDQLHAMVARSRADGYAFNEGRIISGMFAIGVPVRDQEGRPVAALTVAATTERMQGERRMALVSWITDAANSLGERLNRVGGGRS